MWQHWLLCSASDNIPKADEIRTLVKDIWDTRIAKLRLSADSFVRQMEAHARVRLTSHLYMFTMYTCNWQLLPLIHNTCNYNY